MGSAADSQNSWQPAWNSKHCRGIDPIMGSPCWSAVQSMQLSGLHCQNILGSCSTSVVMTHRHNWLPTILTTLHRTHCCWHFFRHLSMWHLQCQWSNTPSLIDMMSCQGGCLPCYWRHWSPSLPSSMQTCCLLTQLSSTTCMSSASINVVTVVSCLYHCSKLT